MYDSGPVTDLVADIQQGNIIPYLGPGVLDGVVSQVDGTAIPADSDSLILAMNNGTPMAPRLMYEFPRAAMNLELKKGRKFVENFLTKTYGETQWSESPFHKWLASLNPPYVIDINRDTQLQDQYKDIPHTLIVGVARIGGTDYRFKLFSYRDGSYRQVSIEEVDASLPILFKPMGTPLPEANYVASDADYVDYITELMGGFAIPAFLKLYRRNKQYLFIGTRFQRDTERMVMSDIIYDAAPMAGYVLLPNPTEKERRFCQKKNLQLIETDWHSLLSACGAKAG
ncbi:MAG: SIR2 family protein [Gammaproteobacteria bacterium]|nr:MAG: SIR2 family protein [Gammaproteobacteria bacterium]